MTHPANCPGVWTTFFAEDDSPFEVEGRVYRQDGPGLTGYAVEDVRARPVGDDGHATDRWEDPSDYGLDTSLVVESIIETHKQT